MLQVQWAGSIAASRPDHRMCSIPEEISIRYRAHAWALLFDPGILAMPSIAARYRT
jgi:hypothetical protein